VLFVDVRKDVAEYQPKVIGKLTLRTLLALLGGALASLGLSLYLYFVLGLYIEDYLYGAILISAAFLALGVLRPFHLPLERFIPLYIQHKATESRLLWKKDLSTYLPHRNKKRVHKRPIRAQEAYIPSKESTYGQRAL
jgi:hypothetical protein